MNETRLPLSDLLLSFKKEYETAHSLECRFQYCTATTAETDSYIYLRSYRTIVAIYDKRTNLLYDILRPCYGFTRTSVSHIAKFRNYISTVYSVNPLIARYSYKDADSKIFDL